MPTDIHMRFTKFLETISDSPLGRDPDGDYVISYSGAKFYARLLGEVNTVVQFFSVVAADLPAIPEIYVYINELNSKINFVRAFHIENQILIESEFHLRNLNHETFDFACRHIARESDNFAEEIRSLFGGTPRWQTGKKPNYKLGFI
jgi:hypothetical protein